MSASFTVMVGSRRSARESTSDIMSLSNTSDSGPGMRLKGFSRCFVFLFALYFVVIHVIKAVLQGNHSLEEHFPP